MKNAWTRLAVMISAAALVVIAGERFARSLVDAPLETRVADGVRAANVRVLAHDPAVVPADLLTPAAPPSLLLVGNSHTYALPGLAPGQAMRPDPGRTLVDRLAAHVPAAPDATFVRLSYPNLRPFEMLTRAAHLDALGYRPEVVVLGVTWRNLARESALREEIRAIYDDPAQARTIRALLGSPSIDADRAVLAAVDAEIREGAADRERARVRSLADRYDDVVSRWLGERVTLLGRSADLRARVYRSTANWAQVRLGSAKNATYDVIPADLALNLACLHAFVRLYAARGTRVVVYFAPERADLAPMIDTGPAAESLARLAAWVTQANGAVVDARDVVPAADWGWEKETPDRSHFTEPGHEALAAFIVAHVPPELWRGLAAPAGTEAAR